jgi:predicted transcriptional regulator
MLEAAGGSAAERVLLFLQANGQSHGREIGDAFAISQSQIQKQLRKRESGRVLVCW